MEQQPQEEETGDKVEIHILDHHLHQQESLLKVVVLEEKIKLLVDQVVQLVVPVAPLLLHMLVAQQ